VHTDGTRTKAASKDASRVRLVLVLVGILLLAANLRPALTSVAPLIGTIRTETGISNAAAGLLTALPLLAFGALSPVVPWFGRRLGTGNALLAGMLLLAAGVVIRSAGSTAALFAGTLVVGAAIVIGNVLLPSLVKREFPGRVGVMTSVYTTTLGVIAALASGVSFPLSSLEGLGWRGALALWAVPAVLAALAWFAVLRRLRRNGSSSSPVERAALGGAGLLRSPLAWQVTAFMGLQSLTYYSTLTWLPEIMRSEGVSVAGAGWLLALSQFIAIPAMTVAPVVAGRRPSQRGVVSVAVGLSLVATLGLLLAGGTAAWFWVVLLGLGQGACFSLALTFFALRAADPESAAALSGMAQSIGYLFSALGPFFFGVLRDTTGGWDIPLVLLLALTACLLVAGLGAARDARVPEDT
jgi:MFS transporter, CP family, cyanate transporter